MMKGKRMMILSLVGLLVVSLLMTCVSATEAEIKVYLNGDLLSFDVAPENANGRTMVPMRSIFEALGLQVTYDSDKQLIQAHGQGMAIALEIGSQTAKVNGQSLIMDQGAYVHGGRTMVPLRFIAESTGASVYWDSPKYAVVIESHVGQTVTQEEAVKGDHILSYPIVDTGVTKLYTDSKSLTTISENSPFYGQDGHYDGNQPTYQDNGDGTVTDLVTGLMWQQTMDAKMTFDAAFDYAENSTLAGYDDWRLPTIKELFSLILFTGSSGGESADVLYIDTDYFNQPIGDTSIGEREIDAQVWSSTEYVGTTMKGDQTVFGVNFVDGRIKGYGMVNPRTQSENTAYFRLVRGDTSYGVNNFIDNGDGTITDLATGLMWQMADDGQTRDWASALDYAETLTLTGYEDWRLSNIKELQSLVDYTRSPQTTDEAAIDPMFDLTNFIDAKGDSNFGFYWSSTTHQDGINTADSASYVAFGEALGQMNGQIMDVHGAGAVRSDPKSGDPEDYPVYRGPQGDIVYVYNYVLAVRTADLSDYDIQ